MKTRLLLGLILTGVMLVMSGCTLGYASRKVDITPERVEDHYSSKRVGVMGSERAPAMQRTVMQPVRYQPVAQQQAALPEQERPKIKVYRFKGDPQPYDLVWSSTQHKKVYVPHLGPISPVND